MITFTVFQKQKKGGAFKSEIKCFTSINKAREFALPIVAEMRKKAQDSSYELKAYIDGMSYDDKSEGTMLQEIGLIENDSNSINVF